MTGNGNHTTYKNGDDWGMVYGCLWHCLTHITPNPKFHRPKKSCRGERQIRSNLRKNVDGRHLEGIRGISWELDLSSSNVNYVKTERRGNTVPGNGFV